MYDTYGGWGVRYLQNIISLFMFRLKAQFLTIFFLQIAFPSNLFADKPLRVGLTYWPPYQIYDEESVISGIAFDVLMEVEKRMGLNLEIIRLPQKRMLVYFQKGELDIEPAANPKWRSAYKHLSIYSVPYFQVQHVIYVRKSTEINGNYVADFKGKTIGTRLGYNYDLTIGKGLNDGLIKRKDSQQHDTSLMLLKAGRIDAIVIDRQELKYWIKTLDFDTNNFIEAYEIGPSIDVSMRLHKNQYHLLPQINQTLKEMLEEGFVDRTIIKYTNKSEVQRISKNNLNKLIYNY